LPASRRHCWRKKAGLAEGSVDKGLRKIAFAGHTLRIDVVFDALNAWCLMDDTADELPLQIRSEPLPTDSEVDPL
jgi:hypothetical protein